MKRHSITPVMVTVYSWSVATAFTDVVWVLLLCLFVFLLTLSSSVSSSLLCHHCITHHRYRRCHYHTTVISICTPSSPPSSSSLSVPAIIIIYHHTIIAIMYECAYVCVQRFETRCTSSQQRLICSSAPWTRTTSATWTWKSFTLSPKI